MEQKLEFPDYYQSQTIDCLNTGCEGNLRGHMHDPTQLICSSCGQKHSLVASVEPAPVCTKCKQVIGPDQSTLGKDRCVDCGTPFTDY